MIQIGAIISVFVIVIVGIALFIASSQEVGDATNTVSVANLTITAPVNGGIYNFTDYKSVSGFSATNTTDGSGQLIAAGNYTVTNNQLVDGVLTAQLEIDSADMQSVSWNLTFTGEPLDYISDSGARAVALIIPIFFALVIALVALMPSLRNELFDMIKGK